MIAPGRRHRVAGASRADEARRRHRALGRGRAAGDRGLAQPPRRRGGGALPRGRRALRAADDRRLRLPRRRHRPRLPASARSARRRTRSPGSTARLRRWPARRALMQALELAGVVKDYRGLRPLRVADARRRGGRSRGHRRSRSRRRRGVRRSRERRAAAGRRRRARAGPLDGRHHRRRRLAGVARCASGSSRSARCCSNRRRWRRTWPCRSRSTSIRCRPTCARRSMALARRSRTCRPSALDRPIGDAPPVVRLRVHLAKALALGPKRAAARASDRSRSTRPTSGRSPRRSRAWPRRARLTVVALTEDAGFADVVATRAYKLNGGTGALTSTRGWRRFLS